MSQLRSQRPPGSQGRLQYVLRREIQWDRAYSSIGFHINPSPLPAALNKPCRDLLSHLPLQNFAQCRPRLSLSLSFSFHNVPTTCLLAIRQLSWDAFYAFFRSITTARYKSRLSICCSAVVACLCFNYPSVPAILYSRHASKEDRSR